MHYTERLKELRTKAGLSQKDVADYLHCTQRAYAYYEQGKRCLPVKYLILLAEYYHVPTDYILGVSEYL